MHRRNCIRTVSWRLPSHVRVAVYRESVPLVLRLCCCFRIQQCPCSLSHVNWGTSWQKNRNIHHQARDSAVMRPRTSACSFVGSCFRALRIVWPRLTTAIFQFAHYYSLEKEPLHHDCKELPTPGWKYRFANRKKRQLLGLLGTWAEWCWHVTEPVDCPDVLSFNIMHIGFETVFRKTNRELL